jgi:DNA-binding cell septation regulator SpoVG
MEIKILNWKKIDTGGPLKAIADIWVEPGWIIRGIRVSRNQGREPYIKLTDTSIRDRATGALEHFQQVFFPPEIWKAVEKAIVKKFYEEERTNTDGSAETNL